MAQMPESGNLAESARADVAELLPELDSLSAPFWEGLKTGQLRLQRCAECGHFQFPPAPKCSACLADDVTWVAASGRARLWSKVVFWKPYLKQYPDTPYCVVLAELEEGPLVTARMSRGQAEGMDFDQPLRAVFHTTADGTALLAFTAAD